MSTPSFVPPRALATYRARVEQVLERVMPTPSYYNDTLAKAMRHATLIGGKRVRASLVYAFAAKGGAQLEQVDDLAAAVECIHAYSLVHDDLPCMDDDEMRRGQPTVHTLWDEATAVLTGDALQTLAFELIANASDSLGADIAIKVVRILSQASGVQGMVGGQMLDLEQFPTITELHSRKTGALIVASGEIGAVAANGSERSIDEARQYAKHLGLLFQIVDDILDATEESMTLGKTSGKDAEQDKNTYIKLLGIDGARAEALKVRDKALACLQNDNYHNAFLEELTQFVYNRTS